MSKMAFLVTSPISMMRPIMLIMFIVPRDTSIAKNTPISDSGSDSMIASGWEAFKLRRQDQVDKDNREEQRLREVADGLFEVFALSAEVDDVTGRQFQLGDGSFDFPDTSPRGRPSTPPVIRTSRARSMRLIFDGPTPRVRFAT